LGRPKYFFLQVLGMHRPVKIVSFSDSSLLTKQEMQQVDHSNPITLSRFILAEKTLQRNNDLCILFNSIELACKVISSAVRRAGESIILLVISM
jgi:hypothetical protein